MISIALLILRQEKKIQDRISLYTQLKKPILFCTTGLTNHELDDIKISLKKCLFLWLQIRH